MLQVAVELPKSSGFSRLQSTAGILNKTIKDFNILPEVLFMHWMI